MSLVQKTIRLTKEQVKYIEQLAAQFGIDDFSKALRLLLTVVMKHLDDTIKYYLEQYKDMISSI